MSGDFSNARDVLLQAAAIGYPWVETASAQLGLLLLEGKTRTGQPLRLCDFASAGADGSAYQSWLKTEGIAPTPFTRAAPGRTAPLP